MWEIPVIDVTTLVSDRQEGDDTEAKRIRERIYAACCDTGFFCVTGTRVSPGLTDAIRSRLPALFALPVGRKRELQITRDNYRGFVPLGFFSPNDGSGHADWYEAFKLHYDFLPADPLLNDCALYGSNRWPHESGGLKALVAQYWRELDELRSVLMAALCEGLGLASSTLDACFGPSLTNMTLLHYPVREPTTAGYGIHPHKDTSALTIIAHDPVGRLEVRTRDGDWMHAVCPKDGFIINIGDMLELWSGGRLVSTPHRVTSITTQPRYSFPWFAVPRHDVVVEPLLARLPGFSRPPVHCGFWSAEVWRTNWPDQKAGAATPELGTLHDAR